VPLKPQHLRTLRNARGTRTQTELAGALGISQAMIAQVESGKKQPSDALLKRWAKEVGLTCEIRREVAVRLLAQKG
jgi:transcriptional regulator with XRE-family HTH domain